MSNKLIVGYARVSRLEQADSEALEQQIDRLKKKGVSEVFIDIESGRSNTRKEFNRLIKLCEEKKISEIIITRIDRLGRSAITIHKTIEILNRNNIKLNILDAPTDTTSSFGLFNINLMAGLAEFESRLLGERIIHGYNYLRQENKANPRVPFGYKRVDEKYVIDETKLVIVNDIINHILGNGGTLRNTIIYIKEKYNLNWVAQSLSKWLNNPVLDGHTPYGVNKNKNDKSKWDIRYDTHEPLITKDIREKINNKLISNSKKWGANINRENINNYQFASKVYCGCCNYKCYPNKHKRFRCSLRDSRGSNFCENKNTTKLSDLINAVNNKLISRYLELVNLTINNLELNNKINSNPKLVQLNEQLFVLKSLPISDTIQSAIDSTLIEINNIEKSEINLVKLVDTELLEILSTCFSDINFWNTFTLDEQIQIYNKLVNKVIILNGKVIEIILNI